MIAVDRSHANQPVVIVPSPARARSYLLSTSLLIHRRVEAIFEFFSNARNLERITPAFLRFNVLTPEPIDMRGGTLIDYRLRVRGWPIRWQSEITVWDPPHRFVDEQRRGPYRYWHHEHYFEAVEGGTMVRDEVTYQTPGGSLVNRLLVAPDLRKVFEFRRAAILGILGSDGSA